MSDDLVTCVKCMQQMQPRVSIKRVQYIGSIRLGGNVNGSVCSVCSSDNWAGKPPDLNWSQYAGLYVLALLSGVGVFLLAMSSMLYFDAYTFNSGILRVASLIGSLAGGVYSGPVSYTHLTLPTTPYV